MIDYMIEAAYGRFDRLLCVTGFAVVAAFGVLVGALWMALC